MRSFVDNRRLCSRADIISSMVCEFAVASTRSRQVLPGPTNQALYWSWRRYFQPFGTSRVMSATLVPNFFFSNCSALGSSGPAAGSGDRPAWTGATLGDGDELVVDL